MINTVKGKALEVAEYLTPVLKVSGEGLTCSALAAQVRVPSVDGCVRRWRDRTRGWVLPLGLGFWASVEGLLASPLQLE